MNQDSPPVARSLQEGQQDKTPPASFQGPLPAPGILEQYSRIIPNAPERILSLIEQDARHQHHMEHLAITAAIKEIRLGQLMGFGVAILSLLATLLLAWMGAETTASIVGGTTVVGLATVFVIGRFTRRKDIDEPDT